MISKNSILASSFGALALSCSSLIAVPTVAVYDLDKPLSESGISTASLLDLSAPARPLTHFDIVRSLEKAATDMELKAVVLDVDNSNLSLAQIQEIRDHLLTLRKADKDVWLYTERLSTTTALLGSAANHMTLMPVGNVMLNGLYAENMYFKSLLDKVGVKVEVIHIGDFKSAGETFYRDSPSKYAAEQQDQLLDSLFDQITQQIATGRGLSQLDVKNVIDKGSLTAQEALDAKLVDHLEYRTDFINKIRAHYGEEADFDKTYELPDPNGPGVKGFFDLMKLVLNSGKESKSTTPYIAVIALEGTITDQSIAPVRQQILKATRNDQCKGIVLRVNSPGGSALASDVLWEATDEFKATGRPFVVSMGAVAASGGYYVSAAADRIFAEPGTITGSIGVVGMKYVVGDALANLGINIHSSKRGKHADLMNMTRHYTAEESKIVKDSMLDVYKTFKKRITDGRGDRIKGDLEKLAGGRVYSGNDALEIGLIDELGGLSNAISFAITQSKEDTPDVRLLPKPKSPFEGMFAKPPVDKHEFISASVPNTPAIQLREEFLSAQTIGLLNKDQMKQINRFFEQFQALKSQQIMLISPAINLK